MQLAVTFKFRPHDAFMSLPIISGKPQQLSVVTRLGDGRFGAQIRQAKEIFLNQWIPGVKQLERKSDHSSLPRAEIKNEWRLHGVYMKTYSFNFYCSQ
jgi:hypothetical protein